VAGELDGTHWTWDSNFSTSRQLALVRFHLKKETTIKYYSKRNFQFRSWLAFDIRDRIHCCTVLQIQFKAMDVSAGDTKSDTVYARCALNSLKQYAMMRHILFKLEYLQYLPSRWQCKEMEAATRIFLCSGESLFKLAKTLGSQWSLSYFRNWTRDHSTISQHWSSRRDLAFATIYR